MTPAHKSPRVLCPQGEIALWWSEHQTCETTDGPSYQSTTNDFGRPIIQDGKPIGYDVYLYLSQPVYTHFYVTCAVAS